MHPIHGLLFLVPKVKAPGSTQPCTGFRAKYNIFPLIFVITQLSILELVQHGIVFSNSGAHFTDKV